MAVPARLAINGLGRIGRCVLRAWCEGRRQGRFKDLNIVAINEPAPLSSVAHLMRYDSTHGRFQGNIEALDAVGARAVDGHVRGSERKARHTQNSSSTGSHVIKEDDRELAKGRLMAGRPENLSVVRNLVVKKELTENATLKTNRMLSQSSEVNPESVRLRPALEIDGHQISFFSHRTIGELQWGALNIDMALDCTGRYVSFEDLAPYLDLGVRRVLLSQPGERPVPVVVYGLNERQLKASMRIASCGSCTSNAVALVIDVLNRSFGIEAGLITTLHSMMNDQPVIDAYHDDDLRKSRAAGQSMIPVRTFLAEGIGRVLPHLDGRFSAYAMRVPTLNVTAIDLSISCVQSVSVAAVNQALCEASSGALKGLLGCITEPLASCDFNHDARSAIVDLEQTQVSGGRLVKLLVWFDNEWGYANRMLDVARYWHGLESE